MFRGGEDKWPEQRRESGGVEYEDQATVAGWNGDYV
jgi:hypothetical protein